MFLESPWPSFSIYSYLFVTTYLKDIFSYPCTLGIPITCIFDYHNLWIDVSPVGLNPHLYFDAHLFRRVSELRACAIRRAQSLRLDDSCISIYDTTTKFLGRVISVLVFARKKDYISLNRSPLFFYLYERRKNLEEHGASVENSS